VPISGLVVTFTNETNQFTETLEQLAAHPAIDLGDASGTKLAIVVDTPSRIEDQDLWGWVHNLPGVERVDVVFVGLDEP
jgi:nitrate reductase NapAB chaperone NapD